MKFKKAPLALSGIILLIGLFIFLIMGGFTSEQDQPEPKQSFKQHSSAKQTGNVVDSSLIKETILVPASTDQKAKLLLPSQVVGQAFPEIDMDVLAASLPQEKFVVFERARQEFPEVDWTEIEQTHQAFLAKRNELPLNLNDQQREAYATWLGEVDPMSRTLIGLRAEAHGLSAGGMEGERGFYIDGFRDGKPVYVVSTNVSAAVTTGVNQVRWNPGFDAALGSNTIDGGQFYVTICDFGEIREHAEFQLPSAGGSRIVFKETGAYSDHMTHVAGTIAAWGYNTSAQGMAPRAWVRALIQQSTSDFTNYGMATPGQQMAALNPITGNPQLRSVVGNTSLGSASPNNSYDSSSATYDTIMRDYPYYMHLGASGNSGDLGYESITGTWKVAKNMVSIGNTTAATRDAAGVFTGGAVIAANSSLGPSRDGRIKPDFVAKGTSVYSSTGTTAYSSYSGTSMASPNAAGSVALLMDYVRLRLPQQYLRSSTYRALLTATADDLGNPGPDYTYGWGILNVHAAAKIIRQQADIPALQLIIEDTLAPSQTWTKSYACDGTKPIRLSICWLDPASTNTDATSRASRLVNDLDLRLIGPDGTEHRPYVMPFTTGQGGTPAFDASLYSANAVTGDNTTDPVELVHIPAPAAGTYVVSISHKGNLLNNLGQPFSVAVSGLSNAPPVMEVSRGGSTIDPNGVNGVSGTTAGTATQLSYTISNLGDEQMTLTTPVTISNTSNCSVTVNTQPATTLSKGQNTALVLSITPSASGNWSFRSSVSNNDPYKNPYAWTVTGNAGTSAPLMVVTDTNGYLPVGGTRSLTGTIAGSASQMTSTISNLGNANLSLTTPITVTPVSNCAITATSQPTSPIAASGSANLVLSITPSVPGAWSASVSIASNDTSKSPYTWTISGTAIGKYAISYLGNNHDGGAPPSDAGSPYLEGSTVTVLGNTGALTRSGYGFAGWNTAANGSGTSYTPGEVFTMPGSALTLHAVWNASPSVDAGPNQSVSLADGATSAGLHYGEVPGNIDTSTPNPKTQLITNVAAYTENAIAGNTTEIYTGQIYDADGQISFTEHIDDKARIWIDGVLVINNDSYSTRTSTANLNLTPGWHNIEIRISNGSGGSGPTASPGIAYDPAGGTAWQTLSDPGNQSLLRVGVAASAVVNLDGTVADADGPSLTTTWTVQSGPGSVSIANVSAIDTTATFTQAGTYVLRLSASDGYTTSTDDVTIVVGPALPAKYASWSGGAFTNPFTDTALTSNPDGDSMNNLMEFAFGTDPTVQDGGALAIDGSANGSPTLTKNAGIIEFYFVRRKDHGTSGSVSYTPQFSSNLSGFTDSPATPTFVANSSVNTNYEVVKVPFPNGTKFGRVQIVTVP